MMDAVLPITHELTEAELRNIYQPARCPKCGATGRGVRWGDYWGTYNHAPLFIEHALCSVHGVMADGTFRFDRDLSLENRIADRLGIPLDSVA